MLSFFPTVYIIFEICDVFVLFHLFLQYVLLYIYSMNLEVDDWITVTAKTQVMPQHITFTVNVTDETLIKRPLVFKTPAYTRQQSKIKWFSTD